MLPSYIFFLRSLSPWRKAQQNWITRITEQTSSSYFLLFFGCFCHLKSSTICYPCKWVARRWRWVFTSDWQWAECVRVLLFHFCCCFLGFFCCCWCANIIKMELYAIQINWFLKSHRHSKDERLFGLLPWSELPFFLVVRKGKVLII